MCFFVCFLFLPGMKQLTTAKASQQPAGLTVLYYHDCACYRLTFIWRCQKCTTPSSFFVLLKCDVRSLVHFLAGKLYSHLLLCKWEIVCTSRRGYFEKHLFCSCKVQPQMEWNPETWPLVLETIYFFEIFHRLIVMIHSLRSQSVWVSAAYHQSITSHNNTETRHGERPLSATGSRSSANYGNKRREDKERYHIRK